MDHNNINEIRYLIRDGVSQLSVELGEVVRQAVYDGATEGGAALAAAREHTTRLDDCHAAQHELMLALVRAAHRSGNHSGTVDTCEDSPCLDYVRWDDQCQILDA